MTAAGSGMPRKRQSATPPTSCAPRPPGMTRATARIGWASASTSSASRSPIGVPMSAIRSMTSKMPPSQPQRCHRVERRKAPRSIV